MIQKIIELKIPSLAIIGIFAWLSLDLLKSASVIGSPSGIGGMASLIVTILLGIHFFLENRIKEHYESIINTLQEAMKNISTTHSKFEDHTQKNLTEDSKEVGKGQYEDISSRTETST